MGLESQRPPREPLSSVGAGRSDVKSLASREMPLVSTLQGGPECCVR